MTKREFLISMATLTALVGREMPDAQVDAWFLVLGDLKADQLQRGIVNAVRSHEFAGFPPIAVILKHAGVSETKTLSHEERAAIAWTSVRQAVGTHGIYPDVCFDDPLINAAIRRLGGWVRVCEPEGKDFYTWMRRDFEQVYSILLTTGINASEGQILLGQDSANNSLTGYEQIPGHGNRLRLVETNLPPVDRKLIRGVIREPARLVALPESREFVDSLSRESSGPVAKESEIPFDPDALARRQRIEGELAIASASRGRNGQVVEIRDRSEKPFKLENHGEKGGGEESGE